MSTDNLGRWVLMRSMEQWLAHWTFALKRMGLNLLMVTKSMESESSDPMLHVHWTEAMPLTNKAFVQQV